MMKKRWLVSPYFFEQRDDALCDVLPLGADFTLNDVGGVEGRSAAALARIHRPIAEFSEQAARKRIVPVSIAGDCMASLPVMAGLQKVGLAPVLVWLDAHGDFNTAETSPSGFLGGMPLAMMVGRGDLTIACAVGLRAVPEGDIWLVDARDLDPLEAGLLDQSRVNRCTMAQFGALQFDRPVHLHIDNDVLDATEVPANNYPVAGGPGLSKTIDACRAFSVKNDLCAVSFSGWNGRLDKDGKTALACQKLMQAVVGVT